ncbi:IS4 family transposase [Planctomycetota bacterium]
MVWAFVGQVLDPDQSCNQALARIQSHRLRLGLKSVSTDTGGYCKARQRLPEQLFKKLFQQTGQTLTRQAAGKDLWHGRHVKVVDGSHCSMPDTPANQKAFGQPPGQSPGCGFPTLAFVGVFCLATGVAIECALGGWVLHDLSLFCLVRTAFEAGDILLADRGFCCYVEMALMQKQSVDTVVRLHQRRKTDFRRGRILGIEDHIVTWTKPQNPPRRVKKKDFYCLPEMLEVREIRYRVDVKGFRTQEITLATTLLDAQAYPPDDLADLYFQRWGVELDFRHIKITLQMDVLRCKSPQMVRKELWCHLLAYNLIRHLMWEAEQTKAGCARCSSFKGTIQYLISFRAFFAVTTRQQKKVLLNQLLDLVATQEVPCRPHRLEPRVKKRRPKKYNLMNKPRVELRAALMRG